MDTQAVKNTQVLMEQDFIKVLLVEDDAVDRMAIEKVLAKCPQSIEFAADSAPTLSEAIECLNKAEYDVILLDLMLPDSDGINTVQNIHNTNPYIPIVVLTGLNDEQMGLSAIKAGAMDYLVKQQVSDNMLARTIRYSIERKQMQQALQEAHDKLEMQVKERTRKLSKTNELLNKEIIERQQIEDALRSNEENLRKVITINPEGIIVLDNNGIIIFANPAADALFGCKAKTLLGQNFEFPLALDKATEIEIVRQKANVAIAEIHAVQIEWEKQNAYLVSLHNITERKNAEEKMQEAVEIKSKFVSTASHELRTPLAALKEGIRLVLQEKTGNLNDKQKELLSIVKRNVDRLTRLINDVLDFQKLEAGKMKFDLRENDINEIARDVYDTMAPAVKSVGLDFLLSLQNDLPKVEFDGDKIAQVITNMVSNAMKFTEKGNITIATSKGENTIQVSVTDTGCGIKKQDLPRVFYEFEQLGQEGERKTGGAGLGLTISKAIIEQHRGKIFGESEYNKGTTFHFVLPVKERRLKKRT
ncbi:MAG: ATP-binding protein [Sedimentisphaerales bacterium]|nr:ATP-binding protein [Sedimentisphaerales bacterium]